MSNFGNEAFGPTDLVDGTVHSVNTVYAQLVLQVGPDKAVALAHAAGITSDLPAEPSITLGAGDVSPLELADAYLTFARDGERVEPFAIAKVADARRPHPVRRQSQGPTAMKPDTAHLVDFVLQQVIDRGTGTAAKLDRPVAGKTGTTENNGDAWFAGYTPDYAAVVWMGYPESNARPMDDVHGITVTGGTLPAQIWQQFMASALADVPPDKFPDPPTRCSRPRRPTRCLTVAPVTGDRGSTVTADGTGYNQCVANWYVTVGSGAVGSASRRDGRSPLDHGCRSAGRPAGTGRRPGMVRHRRRPASGRPCDVHRQRAGSGASTPPPPPQHTIDDAAAAVDARTDDDHDEPRQLEELDDDDRRPSPDPRIAGRAALGRRTGSATTATPRGAAAFISSLPWLEADTRGALRRRTVLLLSAARSSVARHPIEEWTARSPDPRAHSGSAPSRPSNPTACCSTFTVGMDGGFTRDDGPAPRDARRPMQCRSRERRLSARAGAPVPCRTRRLRGGGVLVARARADEFGSDRLLIAGESAGAHLAAVTLLRMRDKHDAADRFLGANLVFGAYDLSRRQVSGRVGIAPGTDILDGSGFALDLFLPDMSEEQRRAPDVSPLYADLGGMPPALFCVGTNDHLLDDTLFMAARWEVAGNPSELLVYPDTPHGCIALPSVATHFFPRLFAFFEECLDLVRTGIQPDLD